MDISNESQMLKGNLNRSHIKFVCYWEILPNHDKPTVKDSTLKTNSAIQNNSQLVTVNFSNRQKNPNKQGKQTCVWKNLYGIIKRKTIIPSLSDCNWT